MELDSEWIKDYESKEQPYKDFYKEKAKTIEIYYFYLNQSNELEKIKQHHYILQEDNKLSKQQLINEIKSNIIDNKIKYSLLSVLKHNINLDPTDLKSYLQSKDSNEYDNFLSLVSNLNDVYFEDTISFLQPLNSLFIIFNETSEKRRKNMTKKIYLSHHNRKTKKKPLKKTPLKLTTHTY